METLLPGTHSRVGGSGAKRWMICPGSVPFASRIPQAADSEFAAEGTVAHHIMEKALNAPMDEHGTLRRELGNMYEADGFLFVVDREMAENIWEVISFITDWERQNGAHPNKRRVEVTVQPCKDAIPDAFGQVDYYNIGENRDCLVLDLKYGAGVHVPVQNNAQKKYYCSGVLEREKPGRIERFISCIGQPRTPGKTIELCEYSLPQLRSFQQNLIDCYHTVQEAERADDITQYLRAGEHCRFCPALLHCPAYHDWAFVFGGKAPVALTDEELGEIFVRIPTVREYLKKAQEEALTRMLRGQKVPDAKLVHGKSSRHWSNERKAKKVLTARFGDDAYTERELKSVAQIEKLEGGKEAVAELSYKKPGGLTATFASDTKAEVTRSTAAEAFTKYLD